ncbi:hypothetical protein [Thalassobacillus sp. CUG 92003]|uniref:hypothetical protein n=1 Tax=Thalassobacillus sp. CUG 92003 TaxID=2736641 RepID=UPI0015E73F6A|nr:hypothetical protein [Thalassobacillus sp. CUG 92003]
MIIQIEGNVKYPITLDPTVWIFDDRKRSFQEVFEPELAEAEAEQEDEVTKRSKRWNREVYQQKLNPPVNKSISRFEKEKILKGTFLMPLSPFIQTSEPDRNAQTATLITENGEYELPADDLKQALLLFSEEGKPLKDKGPVHLYFEDGSNRESPIKGITKIIFS